MAKEGFVNIHGKDYETVASRVNRFREHYADYSIISKIIKIDAEECIVEASILDELGRIIANGHAQEFRGASQINKTSYVENCETSAIGRALLNFGVGGSEFASANEVQNAIHQQNNEGRAKAALKPAPLELVMPSFDTLPAEEQEFILNVAMEITAAINDEDMTEAHRLASSLDNDEKLALWSRLDSKQRSALKRHAESLKG